MVEEFLKYQEEIKGLSANTLRAYREDLKCFILWAKLQGLRWSKLTKQDIDSFISNERAKGKSATTTNRRLSSIRSLLTWAFHEGKLNSNPAQYCQSHKVSDRLPEGSNPDEIERYLQSEARTDRARYIHALTALIKDTGIRLQEALDLRMEDFDIKEQSIKIHGKGDKERIVYYTSETTKSLGLICGMYAPHIFPQKGQRSVRFDFYAEMREAGLSRTHPHALRHMFATEMLNHGADLKVVSHLLGHSTVKVTERYARVSAPTAKAVYMATH